MIDGLSLYLALELWGCIFCILFVMFLFVNRDAAMEGGRALQSLTFCIAMILLNDIIAWAFRGQPGTAAFWAVRVSNFLVFALGYLCVILAALYLLRVVFRFLSNYPTCLADGLYLCMVQYPRNLDSV